MQKILLSYIGNNDCNLNHPEADKRKSGAIVSAIYQAKEQLSLSFDKVCLLYDQSKYLLFGQEICQYCQKDFPNLTFDYIFTPAADPITHDLVYPAMYRSINKILAENSDGQFYISISSGTPTMHACWIFLVKGGVINGELLQVSPQQGLTKINLEIDAFPQITKVKDLKAELTYLKRENDFLKNRKLTLDIPEIGGSSKQIIQIKKQIEQLARFPIPVLILGESGTGKEVVARALHNYSERKSGPFIAINCGAISENLVESELFGHIKGAFTGSTGDSDGAFKRADGGTIFLDEIGDLPLFMQVKLLRVLQEKKFTRVGEIGKEISVDVRVISATNKNLWELMQSKLFREDLFFRITDEIIELPPLRERGDDIVELSQIILEQLNIEYKTDLILTKEALVKIKSHSWPGNIRELGQIIRRAFVYANKKIGVEDIRFVKMASSRGDKVELTAQGVDLKEILDKIELDYIHQALQITDGNQAKAEKLLNMTNKSIQNRLTKHPTLRDVAKTRK